MILSFRCKDTERLAGGYRVRRFQPFERVAQRKLAQLDAAATLDFLRVPPGNRLKALKVIVRAATVFESTTNGDRVSGSSPENAYEAEIVDYH